MAAGGWEGLLRFLRSAGFRFALLFAGIFIGATALFALVLWYATAGSLDRQTDAAMRTDALGLIERWREAGPGAVAEAIDDRLAVRCRERRHLPAARCRWTAPRRQSRPLAARGVPAEASWTFGTVQREGAQIEARLYAHRPAANATACWSGATWRRSRQLRDAAGRGHRLGGGGGGGLRAAGRGGAAPRAGAAAAAGRADRRGDRGRRPVAPRADLAGAPTSSTGWAAA